MPTALTLVPGHPAIASIFAVVVAVMAVPVAATSPDAPGNGFGQGRARDAVIVGFADEASLVQRGRAAGFVDAQHVRRISPLATDTVVMKLPPGRTVNEAIARLEGQAGVEYAEPDYYVSAAATSNDSYYDSLWGMHGDASTPVRTYGSGAAEAWAEGAIGRSDVYVAVLDEGIQTDHPDLVANMDVTRSRDFLSDDDDVYDGPSYGHGTHVAGIIGARGGNGTGVAGVNWRVSMISVKMLGPESNSGAISDTVAAIDYVTALKSGGLDIAAINASWGYQGPPSQSLLDAIERAGDAGLLFVAAAGNAGSDIDEPASGFYPAGYECTVTASGAPRGWDCLITVANLMSTGAMAVDSNFGSSGVDLGAPGSAILSTYPGGYAYASGTSMAAPHVTGAAALCASLDAGAGPATIRQRIFSTTLPTASLSATATGGRLDIGALAQSCAAAGAVAVPDLVGVHEVSLPATLDGVGLVAGARTVAYHPDIATDHVISSDPAADTLVSAGSRVDYRVSLGPDPGDSSPAATVVFADELSSRFVRRGSGWQRAWFGYLQHHFWAPTRSSSALRVGKWKPVLATAGSYRVLAKLPRQHATTRRASYAIKSAAGWVTRVRDQHKRQGEWIGLGIHELTTTPIVKLTDRTGERGSLGRSVAFDALKFVPVTSPAAVPSGLAGSIQEPVGTADEPDVRSDSMPEVDAEPARSAWHDPAADPTPEAVVSELPQPRRAADPDRGFEERPGQRPQPTATPEPTTTPQPTTAPEAASRPKAAPTPRTEPKTRPQPRPTADPGRAFRDGSSTPRDSGADGSSVLVLAPREVRLEVGGTRSLVAYVCPESDPGRGPDRQYATDDDACLPARGVRWSMADPAAADLVELEAQGQTRARQHTVELHALIPADTSVTARAGRLEATGRVVIVPPETSAEAGPGTNHDAGFADPPAQPD